MLGNESAAWEFRGSILPVGMAGDESAPFAAWKLKEMLGDESADRQYQGMLAIALPLRSAGDDFPKSPAVMPGKECPTIRAREFKGMPGNESAAFPNW